MISALFYLFYIFLLSFVYSCTVDVLLFKPLNLLGGVAMVAFLPAVIGRGAATVAVMVVIPIGPAI